MNLARHLLWLLMLAPALVAATLPGTWGNERRSAVRGER